MIPRLILISTGMIVDNKLVRVIEGDVGSIGLFECHETRSVKVLLTNPVSITFG
jgi:hypothetical protein